MYGEFIGRGEKAFYRAYNLPKEIKDGAGNRLHVRVYFNCWGDPIPIDPYGGTSSVHAKLLRATQWAYPKYECYTEGGEVEEDGMLFDVRTLSLMMRGCCPLDAFFEDMGGWMGAD